MQAAKRVLEHETRGLIGMDEPVAAMRALVAEQWAARARCRLRPEHDHDRSARHLTIRGPPGASGTGGAVGPRHAPWHRVVGTPSYRPTPTPCQRHMKLMFLPPVAKNEKREHSYRELDFFCHPWQKKKKKNASYLLAAPPLAPRGVRLWPLVLVRPRWHAYSAKCCTRSAQSSTTAFSRCGVPTSSATTSVTRKKSASHFSAEWIVGIRSPLEEVGTVGMRRLSAFQRTPVARESLHHGPNSPVATPLHVRECIKKESCN